jgi:hypothetical protein
MSILWGILWSTVPISFENLDNVLPIVFVQKKFIGSLNTFNNNELWIEIAAKIPAEHAAKSVKAMVNAKINELMFFSSYAIKNNQHDISLLMMVKWSSCDIVNVTLKWFENDTQKNSNAFKVYNYFS